MTFGEKILGFLANLQIPFDLPGAAEALYPFTDQEVLVHCKSFYQKFYHDQLLRRLIIGINPGRFGGGVTGIPFTDPIRLEENCGITNSWKKKAELSSIYMYQMMHAFGGVQKFYQQFYITSVSPIGFVRNGKNMNYYDDRQLEEMITPFAVDCLRQQIGFGADISIAYCLGDGKNFKFLSKLNSKYKFFEQLIPLSHPRFIMQYRLKQRRPILNVTLNYYKTLMRRRRYLCLKNYMDPLLIYCYDAYCGWCYGFSPVIRRIEMEYRDRVGVEVLSGGMVISDKPAHIGITASYIRDAYPRVEAMTGIKFGADYLWHIDNPDESDWYPNSEKPAIALCIFKEKFPDLQVQFAGGLQQALYIEARDLTDDQAYRNLIEKYNIDEAEFFERLHSDTYKEKAWYEFALCKQLNVSGFPTLFLQTSETKFYLISRGYSPYETVKTTLDHVLTEIQKTT